MARKTRKPTRSLKGKNNIKKKSRRVKEVNECEEEEKVNGGLREERKTSASAVIGALISLGTVNRPEDGESFRVNVAKARSSTVLLKYLIK